MMSVRKRNKACGALAGVMSPSVRELYDDAVVPLLALLRRKRAVLVAEQAADKATTRLTACEAELKDMQRRDVSRVHGAGSQQDGGRGKGRRSARLHGRAPAEKWAEHDATRATLAQRSSDYAAALKKARAALVTEERATEGCWLLQRDMEQGGPSSHDRRLDRAARSHHAQSKKPRHTRSTPGPAAHPHDRVPCCHLPTDNHDIMENITAFLQPHTAVCGLGSASKDCRAAAFATLTRLVVRLGCPHNIVEAMPQVQDLCIHLDPPTDTHTHAHTSTWLHRIIRCLSPRLLTLRFTCGARIVEEGVGMLRRVARVVRAYEWPVLGRLSMPEAAMLFEAAPLGGGEQAGEGEEGDGGVGDGAMEAGVDHGERGGEGGPVGEGGGGTVNGHVHQQQRQELRMPVLHTLGHVDQLSVLRERVWQAPTPLLPALRRLEGPDRGPIRLFIITPEAAGVLRNVPGTDSVKISLYSHVQLTHLHTLFDDSLLSSLRHLEFMGFQHLVAEEWRRAVQAGVHIQLESLTLDTLERPSTPVEAFHFPTGSLTNLHTLTLRPGHNSLCLKILNSCTSKLYTLRFSTHVSRVLPLLSFFCAIGRSDLPRCFSTIRHLHLPERFSHDMDEPHKAKSMQTFLLELPALQRLTFDAASDGDVVGIIEAKTQGGLRSLVSLDLCAARDAHDRPMRRTGRDGLRSQNCLSDAASLLLLAWLKKESSGCAKNLRVRLWDYAVSPGLVERAGVASVVREL